MPGFSALHALPRGSSGRFLLALDARPKLFLAVVAGLTLWRLPLEGLALVGLFAAWICAALGGFRGANRGLWRGYVFFVGFWAALKVLLDVVGGVAGDEALLAAVELATRLVVLLLLGLSLARSASPRRLGVAVAWFLRPVLGRRAFMTALSLALMIHFLPLAWQTASGLARGLVMRWPGCPWRQRIVLVPRALVRVLSRATWTQALAVAARGLERPEAWLPERRARLAEWGMAVVPALALAWGAYS